MCLMFAFDVCCCDVLFVFCFNSCCVECVISWFFLVCFFCVGSPGLCFCTEFAILSDSVLRPSGEFQKVYLGVGFGTLWEANSCRV